MRYLMMCLMMMVVLAGAAHATPGGLDASGCHKPASRTKAYHCHPEKAKNQMHVIESQKSRVDRLRKQCEGKPKRGECRGLGR